MYSMDDIRVKSKLVRDIVDSVLASKQLSVDRIFLVGSYASNRANEYSDIDYLVELRGGKHPYTYPEFNEILEINKKINNERIHLIFGTLEAQQSMQKRDAIRYAYKEI